MNRVAIFGGGPTKAMGSKVCAEKSHDIWILPNVCPELIKVATACFDLHGRDIYGKYIERLKTISVPLFLQDVDPDLPASVKYPIEEITKEFGTYFTNSVSYMIALAIKFKYDEIELFGVEMELDKEYAHQRPSCEYFLGIAAGRGIKVTLPDQSPILRSRQLYGYKERKDIEHAEGRVKILERLLNDHKEKLAEIEKHIRYYEGALDDAKHFLNFIR